MTTLKIGIAPYDEMKARTMAIARGEHKPKRGEPKVWFTSMESFARILSDRNRELLDLIIETEPGSIAELAALSGRAKSNLSRTLKTMERYGLVVLKKGDKGRVKPRVPYSGIVLDVPITSKTHARSSAEVA
jgi:predicted transcriptional regulator